MLADDLVRRIGDRSARIVVMGQGYVGLPVAIRASEVGHREVVGFDVSIDRVDALRRGQSFVGDVSDQRLRLALEVGYEPTTRVDALAGYDVAIISVPTPLRDGEPDLSYIEAAAGELAVHLRRGACVVLESTTYPGTTVGPVASILEAGSGLSSDDYLLGYSPERIDPGNLTHTFVNTPKVVSGTDPAALRAVDAMFSTLVDTTVAVGSTEEAELVKLIENTFRHVNIALVNEVAMFARELGVDIWQAIDAASTKPFGYMRFTPGPGVGGHCLPIDPSYLAWRVQQHLGKTFRFVELANDVNEHMPAYVHQRITTVLNGVHKSVNGSQILLLGLAYKKNTSDWRESPSMELARQLTASGARIEFCDPNIPAVNASGIDHPIVPFTTDALAAADLVVYLVDHDSFDHGVVGQHSPLVFDAINALADTTFVGETL